MSRVVVTGSSGMLGAALTRRMADDGWAVVGLGLAEHEDPHPGVHWIRGDIRDPQAVATAVRGADLVVHAATALPSYPAREVYSVNVGGVKNLLAAAEKAGVPRFVHMSSTAVYGVPDVVPTPETYPASPTDPYSRSKVIAEEAVAAYRGRGMTVPVLRPKTFLGPGRLGLFAMLFEWAEEGRNFPVLGRGDVRCQMLDIDDLVDAVVQASVGPDDAVDDAFNLAATDFTTLREEFQAVLDAAGHHKRVVSLPMGPAAGILKVLGRTGLSPVYERLVHKLCVDSYVATDRARDRLGFTPRHSNCDSLLRNFAWWRENNAAHPRRATGLTSRQPWKQGALALVKTAF